MTAAADKSLLQFILDLLRDPEKMQDFKDDPKGALSACGLSGVTPDQVHDALVIATDNDDVSFDRGYHTGGNQVAGASVPPPPPATHGDHDAGVKYLDKYITNNYVTNNIDDRDTIVDNSVNQNIDTHGGDVNQEFHNNSVTASGDGAVAAGGDIKDSTVTTGHGNVVGDGNKVVNGDDNTTAFGKGSAVHSGDITAKDGSAVSVGGTATGHESTTDSFNKTHTESHSSNDYDHSFNQDHSTHQDTHVDNHSHNDVLSHNDVDVHLPIL